MLLHTYAIHSTLSGSCHENKTFVLFFVFTWVCPGATRRLCRLNVAAEMNCGAIYFLLSFHKVWSDVVQGDKLGNIEASLLIINRIPTTLIMVGAEILLCFVIRNITSKLVLRKLAVSQYLRFEDVFIVGQCGGQFSHRP